MSQSSISNEHLRQHLRQFVVCPDGCKVQKPCISQEAEIDEVISSVETYFALANGLEDPHPLGEAVVVKRKEG